MLALVMQTATSLTPEQLQQLQAQMEAVTAQGADQAYSQVATAGVGAGLGLLSGAMIFLIIILGIIGVVLTVVSLINFYHWGMTDKAVFVSAGEDKKKWFYILVLLPVISSAIMIIPILGWLVGGIGYLYWLVMNFIYFFSWRLKLK